MNFKTRKKKKININIKLINYNKKIINWKEKINHLKVKGEQKLEENDELENEQHNLNDKISKLGFENFKEKSIKSISIKSKKYLMKNFNKI